MKPCAGSSSSQNRESGAEDREDQEDQEDPGSPPRYEDRVSMFDCESVRGRLVIDHEEPAERRRMRTTTNGGEIYTCSTF